MTESLGDVFWRLVGAGLPAGEIGYHPDYCAAYEREHPPDHDCLRCVTERRIDGN